MKTEFKAFLWWDLRNGQDSTKNNSPSLYGWRMYGDYGIVTAAVPAGPADRYPTFYLAKLMKNFARGGDQVVSATSDYPGLSAYAVKTAAGGVNVLLINKHPSLNLPATITLSGYTPQSTATVYSYGKPQDTAAQTGIGSADIAQATIGVPGATLSYTTTSYSATVIAFGAPSTIQPPAAPTGLTASMISNSQINLAWTDNAINETGFKVERSTDQTNWSQIATTAANATSYSNTGLNSTTTYYYRVRAYNSAGDSAYSNISSATHANASCRPHQPDRHGRQHHPDQPRLE